MGFDIEKHIFAVHDGYIEDLLLSYLPLQENCNSNLRFKNNSSTAVGKNVVYIYKKNLCCTV